MPPHRLAARAEEIATLVEAVLAGAPAQAKAAEAGLDPADLGLALHAYRAAGRAALQDAEADAWFHALVRPADWATAETTFANRIAPRLASLNGGQAAWWFLRKHPCWRIRIRTGDRDSPRAALDRLAADGLIATWKPGTYEPEAAAFGGPVAMNIIHDLFCADSCGVLGYARQDPPLLGRRESSLLLIRAMEQQAGLDWFETADVFDRVAQMRPAPAGAAAAQAERLTAQVKSLLAFPAEAKLALFSSSGDDLTAWLRAFMTAGRQLGDAAADARLDRGLRAILAHIVLFHWNRLGLSAHTQGILARVAATAILPRS